MSDIKIEMLWIDMETTGLNADEEVPLELGFMLTDKMGRLVDTFETMVWEGDPIFKDRLATARMHSIIGPMHEKSGLFEDLGNGPWMSRVQAGNAVQHWLEGFGIQPGQMPISGSSIGSLDRPFLIKHFPHLNEFVSYRNIDNSSVKELCRLHNPELFAQIMAEVPTKEDAAHRVLDDIQVSIMEYLMYVESFLFT